LPITQLLATKFHTRSFGRSQANTRAISPPSSTPWLRERWIAAATALRDAAWTALGTTYFRGRGLWIPVGADFLLGGSTGLAAALLPRAHATSLLAIGPAPLSLPPVTSFAALYAVAIACALAAAARSGR